MSSESPQLFPVYPQLPLRIVSGEGVLLKTADGRELIDFYGGHAVAGLGYRHPAILRRLEETATRLFFQTTAIPSPERAAAGEALVDFAPDGLDRAFFVSSGAEANENALRLAFRSRPGRDTVVALTGGFHGRTAAASAVTDGSAKWYAFPEAPFRVRTVPREDADALAAAVDTRVAAVIMEPVLGMAGAVDLSGGFLAAAREACDAAGALLIFDEVQCGMGRSGRPFACEWSGVRPDILTTAKALAGGFPAGAVLASEELAGGLPMGSFGTTFGGGPVASALVATVIRVIHEEGLLARVRRLSDRIRNEAVVGPVRRVQGRGFLLGLVCSRPAKEVRDALLERGIYSGVSTDPAALRLMPPLVLEDEHVDALVAALREIPA
jgi:acetylornithine/succinyldiaminopimelate/putrescine aminotransferase